MKKAACVGFESHRVDNNNPFCHAELDRWGSSVLSGMHKTLNTSNAAKSLGSCYIAQGLAALHSWNRSLLGSLLFSPKNLTNLT